ncbi:MAG TPA: amidohydrolase family protein [Candidatus Micrarchaeia archaeon]|nr:amidohydrolase family protein [Candidatus Micrarchaeia archaeon]
MIDSHCHPIAPAGGPLDVAAISLDVEPGMAAAERRRALGGGRLWHELLLVRLADHLGCAVEEVADARAEASRDWPAYVGGLLRAAGLEGLVVDPGWGPLASGGLAATAAAAGCPVRPILRLEPLIDEAIAEGATAQECCATLDAAVREAVAAGYRGLKTVLAYRTGLAVDPQADLARAEASLRQDQDLPVRRRGTACRDWLLREALGWAAELDWPVQVHTGFGDSEIRLAEADPLLLGELLRSPEGGAATVVLIHGAYPWHEAVAHLALTHPNVYAECSLFNLFAPALVADRLLRILELAPAAKVLVGTDGHGEPETHWFAARVAQEAFSAVRERCLQLGARRSWLDEVETAIFSANTARLYDF